MAKKAPKQEAIEAIEELEALAQKIVFKIKRPGEPDELIKLPPVIMANKHPDEAIVQMIVSRASKLYPTGCHVLFGREQAYAMPIGWKGGPYVLPYSGGKARKVTFEDVEKMKNDSPPKSDPFGWLT
jgi:hypothetical protein